jgi:hypothetical protein
MEGWNHPDVRPAEPGEYQAALDPSDSSSAVRRWWTGSAWSNPYLETFSEQLKGSVRKEISDLKPFWKLAKDSM